ncbi:MarR family winged helix-turn-helix transcriptional regulator [Microbacterium fluvii]|uniref:MarR family winged helix-turn-helix transcriptional regulator n=1 Tax=Microbacterium fluvii TaxID=415215 RepID=A0ABW2HF34_9MICO|nr:MarR family transcriptional regulator [Microbacterium fluvii]MCU4672799.1 MarR family transcriptional regulator [Microbacterium fluvii]
MADDPATDALDQSALVDDLSFLLARANALSIAAGNAALRAHGLKVRSYSVLALAGAAHAPTQREIAECLRLDPSQVVALVDELQRAALVERAPDPRDRRANIIVATATGRALLDRARVAVGDAERELHAGLSAPERATLAELLRKAATA